MHEDSPTLGAPGGDDRLLMSEAAVAARRTEIANQRLARWGVSPAHLNEVRATLDGAVRNGGADIHDVLECMDTLLLDLAVMTIPQGFDTRKACETMVQLPGWRKQ
jgi:hypothetical protein